MKIICISGKAQHGKDTSALWLKEYFEENGKSVLITHYGDAVKYVARQLFGWDGKKDAAGRTLLQDIGTEKVRAVKPDFWVDFIQTLLKAFDDKWDVVLIPDCRFPNEIEGMKCFAQVAHVRVERPNFDNGLSEEQKNHISETALDEYPHQYLLRNDGDMVTLRNRCRKLGYMVLGVLNAKSGK